MRLPTWEELLVRIEARREEDRTKYRLVRTFDGYGSSIRRVPIEEIDKKKSET